MRTQYVLYDGRARTMDTDDASIYSTSASLNVIRKERDEFITLEER